MPRHPRGAGHGGFGAVGDGRSSQAAARSEAARRSHPGTTAHADRGRRGGQGGRPHRPVAAQSGLRSFSYRLSAFPPIGKNGIAPFLGMPWFHPVLVWSAVGAVALWMTLSVYLL